ncbi:membrane hypothetical protein [Desulfovibrionales bacterium]
MFSQYSITSIYNDLAISIKNIRLYSPSCEFVAASIEVIAIEHPVSMLRSIFPSTTQLYSICHSYAAHRHLDSDCKRQLYISWLSEYQRENVNQYLQKDQLYRTQTAGKRLKKIAQCDYFVCNFCVDVFAAHYIKYLSETNNLALSSDSNTFTVTAIWLHLARITGTQIILVSWQGITTPRHIITSQNMDNIIVLDTVLTYSTNIILPLSAIFFVTWPSKNLKILDHVIRCTFKPTSHKTVGILVVLAELAIINHAGTLLFMVTDVILDNKLMIFKDDNRNPTTIQFLEQFYIGRSDIAVLPDSLKLEATAVKRPFVTPNMLMRSDQVQIFSDDETAAATILRKAMQAEDTGLIRNKARYFGPDVEKTPTPTVATAGLEFITSTAPTTDILFSDDTQNTTINCVSHKSIESSPTSLALNGDHINIDTPSSPLNLIVEPAILKPWRVIPIPAESSLASPFRERCSYENHLAALGSCPKVLLVPSQGVTCGMP